MYTYLRKLQSAHTLPAKTPVSTYGKLQIATKRCMLHHTRSVMTSSTCRGLALVWCLWMAEGTTVDFWANEGARDVGRQATGCLWLDGFENSKVRVPAANALRRRLNADVQCQLWQRVLIVAASVLLSVGRYMSGASNPMRQQREFPQILM